MPSTAAKGPRERILDAAFELFYRNGVGDTGIDGIIAKARVAKASFYDHFKSKDALIKAYTEARRAAWNEWFGRQMAAAPAAPRARLLYVFEVLERFVRGEGFEGCAFIGVGEQVGDPKHPARVVAWETKRDMRQALAALARDAGVRDPERAGLALASLVDGVLVAARMGPPHEIGPALDAARWAAGRLV